MALTNQQLIDKALPEFKGEIRANNRLVFQLTFHAPSKNQAKAHWKQVVAQHINLYDYADKISIKFKEIK
jgi:hypothetical protein